MPCNKSIQQREFKLECTTDEKSSALIFYDYDINRDDHSRLFGQFCFIHFTFLWALSLLIWIPLAYCVWIKAWLPLAVYSVLIIYTYGPIPKRRLHWQAKFFYGFPRFFHRSSLRITSPDQWPDLEPIMRRLVPCVGTDSDPHDASHKLSEDASHKLSEGVISMRPSRGNTDESESSSSRSPQIRSHWIVDSPKALEQVVDEMCHIPIPPRLWLCHPHGFLASGWSQLSFIPYFPYLRNCVANLLFYCGTIVTCYSRHLAETSPVTERFLRDTLKNGHSLTIIPGGFEEATITSMEVDRVYLSARYGVFRLAIEYGAELVPVFVFGESQMHQNFQGYWKLRLWLSRHSIPGILPWGKRGFYPRKEADHHIVIGKPLTPKKNPKPSREEIESLKSEYISQLASLHSQYCMRLCGIERKFEVW